MPCIAVDNCATVGSNEDFLRKTVLFLPILPCGGKAPAESKKSPELEFVRAILVQFCSSEGGVLLFKLRAQHAVFSLQGVKLVVQRGELLFELARDDAPDRICTGSLCRLRRTTVTPPAMRPGFSSRPCGRLAARRAGRVLPRSGAGAALSARTGRMWMVSSIFIGSSSLIHVIFSTLKVSCRMRNVNRGDALQWIEKTCYDDRRFLIRKEARGAMLPR